MDSHNVGRERISTPEALSRIKARTFVAGITSDILFPIKEQEFLVDHIPGGRLFKLESGLGHDGFLTENIKVSEKLSQILAD